MIRQQRKRAPVNRIRRIQKWEIVEFSGVLSRWAEMHEAKPAKIRRWKIFGPRFRTD